MLFYKHDLLQRHINKIWTSSFDDLKGNFKVVHIASNPKKSTHFSTTMQTFGGLSNFFRIECKPHEFRRYVS